MGAIIPLKKLNNRADKRAFIKDASKVALSLEIVNQSFIYDLFNAPAKITYNDIYETHLNKWNKTVKSIVQNKDVTNAAIDILFFAREYGPNQNLFI